MEAAAQSDHVAYSHLSVVSEQPLRTTRRRATVCQPPLLNLVGVRREMAGMPVTVTAEVKSSDIDRVAQAYSDALFEVLPNARLWWKPAASLEPSASLVVLAGDWSADVEDRIFRLRSEALRRVGADEPVFLDVIARFSDEQLPDLTGYSEALRHAGAS